MKGGRMSIQLIPKMKRFFSLFLAALLTVCLLAVNAHAANNKVTDYGDAYGHWAYEALAWAVDNGVMVGTSEDKLNPDGHLTRAHMAAMIDRLFGTYESADISRCTDVSRGSWYYDYIAQAVNMGTFTGYSSSRMGPDDYITREQAIVVLARTVCLPAASSSALSRFPDRNEVGAWAADSVAAMVERGYVSGYNDGRLNPKGQITDSGEITGNYRDTVLVRGAANIHDAVFDGDLILANGLGEQELDLDNITVKGRLVVWGGSAVNISGKSAVAGVVLPRNDGPVRVSFDAAATELSQKDCAIVKPSSMDRGNKVTFTEKADKPTIAFDLPAYLYVGDSAAHTDEQISVTLEKDTALPVTWKITPSNDPDTATAYDGDLTDNGGTIQIISAGTYDIATSLTDPTGRVFAFDGPSIEILAEQELHMYFYNASGTEAGHVYYGNKNGRGCSPDRDDTQAAPDADITRGRGYRYPIPALDAGGQVCLWHQHQPLQGRSRRCVVWQGGVHPGKPGCDLRLSGWRLCTQPEHHPWGAGCHSRPLLLVPW